jgi:acetyl-CoA synthetase
MGYGLDPVKGKDLSSLKVLGTVGEPINEEAWHWYDEHIGKKKCPIVDTWWQTETGGVLISNFAGITPARPSWATLPMPGVQPVLVDENGKEVKEKDESGFLKGNLCIKGHGHPLSGQPGAITNGAEQPILPHMKIYILLVMVL